jgi:hypothetical protein
MYIHTCVYMLKVFDHEYIHLHNAQEFVFQSVILIVKMSSYQ